jgi:phenylacrylic acid decarboxylase
MDVPFSLIPEGTRRTRLVVAVTGATGTSIAIRLLQALRALDIEIHLIVSKWTASTLRYETDFTVEQVRAPNLRSFMVYELSQLIQEPLLTGAKLIPCR